MFTPLSLVCAVVTLESQNYPHGIHNMKYKIIFRHLKRYKGHMMKCGNYKLILIM